MKNKNTKAARENMYKSAEKLKEEFNEVARRFDQNDGSTSSKWIKGNNRTRLLKSYLFDQLPSHGGIALEIGSGLGSFTYKLAERFDHVVALDLSPEMIRVAQKNTGGLTNIDFIQVDVNTWDFPVAHFDCVVSISTLHHMPLEPVLKNMKDTLKPGGVMLVADFYEEIGIKKFVTKAIKKTRKHLIPNIRKKPAVRFGMGHDPHERYPFMSDIYRISKSLLPEANVVKHSQGYSIVWKKP